MLIALPLDGGGDLRQRRLVWRGVQFAGQVHERLVQRVAIQGRDLRKSQLLVESPGLEKNCITSLISQCYSRPPELVQSQLYDSLQGRPWCPVQAQPAYVID